MSIGLQLLRSLIDNGSRTAVGIRQAVIWTNPGRCLL